MNAYNVEKNATLVAVSQAVEAASALPDLGSAPSMARGSEVKNALPLFAATKTDARPNPGRPAYVTGESPRLSDAMIASAIARTE